MKNSSRASSDLLWLNRKQEETKQVPIHYTVLEKLLDCEEEKVYYPVLPTGKSCEVKPKIIELDRKISHKIFISICEFFIDIDDPDNLVDQAVHNMGGIGGPSAEGENGMG